MEDLVSVRDIMKTGLVKRVQVVNDIRFGNLPAKKVGNSYVIKKEDADVYIKWKMKLRKEREERRKKKEQGIERERKKRSVLDGI